MGTPSLPFAMPGMPMAGNGKKPEPKEMPEVAACCEACAETFKMTFMMWSLVDGLMQSPMAGMIGLK